jgi:adenylate kinase
VRLVILGAPGAGKGTQANIVSKVCNIPHISTGEIFRENIKTHTELGEKIQAYMDKGELVPDDITMGVIKNRLMQEDCVNGFILDGFPRTVNQADHLEQILSEMNMSLDKVIDLDVPDDEILHRMLNRRVCSKCWAIYNAIYKKPKVDGKCDLCGADLMQREDDTEEVIKRRLEVYHWQTKPLVEYYKKEKLLVTIRGEIDVEHTCGKVIKAIVQVVTHDMQL